MRISDWSSDVCSSDLAWQALGCGKQTVHHAPGPVDMVGHWVRRLYRSSWCAGFERLRQEPGRARRDQPRPPEQLAGFVGQVAAQPRLRMLQPELCIPNRKRVVEGKCVDVSLNPVGPR